MTRNAFAAAVAATMIGLSTAMPAFGQVATPSFRSGPAYDGNGRKVKPPVHPRHSWRKRTREWQEFARRVESTHRVLPDGTWQDDPRDDKYLNSHARAMRGLLKALAQRAA